MWNWGTWSKIDSKSEKISNFMKTLKKLNNVENLWKNSDVDRNPVKSVPTPLK